LRVRRLARVVHVALAPGESLLPGTREALDGLFEDPLVDAVLLPLVPAGEGALARAARAYLAAWDRRFLHRQNFFAPASRVASREPMPGPRNADATPRLAAALAKGLVIEALVASGDAGGVSTPIARDLGAWVAWAREEGAAWGALAARDARFLGFIPVRSAPAWARHNVLRVAHRCGEVLEATRRVRPTVLLLHTTREAAWTGGAVRALRRARDASLGPEG
jgi:hypothetical protein